MLSMSLRQAIIFMNYEILFQIKANYISRRLITQALFNPSNLVDQPTVLAIRQIRERIG